jgi:hypothetical protein
MTRTRLSGEWCSFRWFQASDLSLGSLLSAVPQLVRDRSVVISSCDSAPLSLPADLIEIGWRQAANLAVSPLSPDPRALPRGGFDEWYLFEDVPSVRSLEVFVNFATFSLCPDPGNEWQLAAVERFWGQVAEWWPESYLADGAQLICVTRSDEILPEVERFFA